eukprot:350351-Prorocentrum_minimum.AAC.1
MSSLLPPYVIPKRITWTCEILNALWAWGGPGGSLEGAWRGPGGGLEGAWRAPGEVVQYTAGLKQARAGHLGAQGV